jgi:hypothetical protein
VDLGLNADNLVTFGLAPDPHAYVRSATTRARA